MEWRWEWFAAGVAGLFGLGLLRGVLRILTPVAAVGVAGYGLGILIMRKPVSDGKAGRTSRSRRSPATSTK